MNKDKWTPERRKTCNYLHFDKKHSNTIILRILIDYGTLNNITVTKKKQNYCNQVSKLIQDDWEKFITWYKQQKYTATADPYTHKKRRKDKSYNEQWSEKNLDGSFAYNGVTDDF